MRHAPLLQEQISNLWLSRQVHRKALSTRSSARPASLERRTVASRRSMPYVFYSQSQRDVTALDVALLLHASKDPSLGLGTPQKTGYYRHWNIPLQGVMRERMLQKLTRAIDRSVAVVAAFTNCDVYDGASGPPGSSSNNSITDKGQGSRSGPSDAGIPGWNWSMKSVNRSQRKRSLIGFARAAGDGSLAATIYDLAVHPDFRGFGVGSRLLKLLTQQLYHKEVYDVGSIVPWEAQRFFHRCSFEEDREQSTTLTFVGHQQWKDAKLVQGVLPGPGWLLDPAWPPHVQGVQGAGLASRGDGLLVDMGQVDVLSCGVQGRAAEESGLLRAGRVGPGGQWWGLPVGELDQLAQVPAPATEALQKSPELTRLLQTKLDQGLAAQAQAQRRSQTGKK